MKTIKWIVVCAVGLIVIAIGALLVIPLFVNMEIYKQEIENQVSLATGRPFSIGGKLKLSLFPWAGVAFTDLHLGNPPGFGEKDLLTIRSFDVRVKLLPLLSRDVRVNRFAVEGLNLVLEKNRDGKGNWEAMGGSSAKTAPAPPDKEKKKEAGQGLLGGLPVKSLAAGEMAVRNGSLIWIDAVKGERKEIKGLGLELKDVSFDRPIRLMLTANLDGNPFQMEGKVGPLGGESGKGNIPLDIAIRAFKELNLTIRGTVSDVPEQPRFDLAMDLAPFSPRKLVGALGQIFPVSTSDPDALTKTALRVRVKGSLSDVSLTDGIMDLDRSMITFSARAADFHKPDIMLRMNMDEIDVDRYLPPAGKKESETGQPVSPPAEKKKTGLAALRKLGVDAEIRVGRVKVMGARIQDALMKMKGKDGLFRVDSLSLKAYQGSLAARADLDVREDRPRAGMNLEMSGVRVRPLLSDVMQKDFLEGTAQAKISLKVEGEDADAIKRTLNGEGNLSFTEGAIIGIDLPGMVRNVKEAFGGEKTTERPKTDFTELLVPFTIRDGLVHTSKTSLASPFLRVTAEGNAHLVQKTLDMRIEPELVLALKDQKDAKVRPDLTIPVLVTGTFSSPRFTPDLKGILETEIRQRLKSPEVIINILRGGGASKENGKETQQDKTKEILRGIFGK